MTRGGIFMICKGSAEADNKFLKTCNANKATSYIIYLDADKSYGHIMMQLLPTEILDWVNPKDFNLDNFYSYSPTACVLEAGFDYPNELHGCIIFVCGQKRKVTKEILFVYQLQIMESDGFSTAYY